MDLTALVEAEMRKQGPIDLANIDMNFDGIAFVGEQEKKNIFFMLP